MYVLNKRTVLTLFVTGALGCGQVKPSDDATAEKEENDGTATAEKVMESFKASWKAGPVDLLIVRENSNRLNQQPIARRLHADDEETPLAYRNLAVRLYNTGVDFQLGVLNAVVADSALWGALKGDAENKNHILKADSFEFIESAVTRMAHSGPDNTSTRYQPLRALQQALTRTDGGNKGFLRKGARLVALFVGYQDETSESVDTSALAEQLDKIKGAGNWTVWYLGPPKNGCSFVNEAEATVYTNADASAANQADLTAEGAMDKINAHQRRAKLIRMTELSGGKAFSICSDSYIDFTSDFANSAVKPAYFSVKLEKKADPATIKVAVNGAPVEDWRYDTATQKLLLPTSIKSGTKFSVEYFTVGDKGGVVNKKGSEGDDVGEIGASNLSEAELAWLTEVDGISPQQAFQQNCVNCHARYRNFDGFDQFKAQSITRINDPDKNTDGTGTDMGMPRNGDPGFAATPAGQAILEWLANY